DDLGVRGEQVLHLLGQYQLGHLRLDRVVDARRAAADVRMRHLDELQAGDRLQELAGLFAYPLRVDEVAGVLVGDPGANLVTWLGESDLVQELEEVANPGSEV